MSGLTIRTLINDGIGRLKEAGIVNSRLEAELLLSRATGWHRPVVLIQTEKPVPDEALDKFWDLIARRCRREPLQQITGDTEFFGLRILVDENVMAPRPETEVLVEQVIKRWKPVFRTTLDIGTGSGCIAVALAMNLPDCSVEAVDISDKALETAGRNVELHDLSGRIELIRADLFPENGKTYEVIVSNPPYIPSGEIDSLMPEVSRYEPRLALDGGGDGYHYYRKIAETAPARLNTPGLLALEVGEGQAEAVMAMMSKAFGLAAVTKAKDLCGAERVIMVET